MEFDGKLDDLLEFHGKVNDLPFKGQIDYFPEFQAQVDDLVVSGPGE